jgi:hypothetical protein
MMACRAMRKWLVRRKLRRVLLAFCREAMFARSRKYAWLRTVDLRRLVLTAEWYWDERDPLDELKAKKAITEGLHNGSEELISVLKKQGVDYRQHRKRAKKVNLDKIIDMAELFKEGDKLKLSHEEVLAAIQQKPAQVNIDVAAEPEETTKNV